MLADLSSAPEILLKPRIEKQPSIPQVKRQMSKALLGYLSEYGFHEIDGNMTEDDGAVVFCTLPRFIFKDLIAPYIIGKTIYQNDFIGWYKDVKTYWMDLMGNHSGAMNVYFVSDDMEYIYVFHNHIQTTYMIGRINPEHELAQHCLRKFKRAKLPRLK